MNISCPWQLNVSDDDNEADLLVTEVEGSEEEVENEDDDLLPFEPRETRYTTQCKPSCISGYVRNETIVETVASNVSRGRLSTVFTTDHRSQICISQFPITLCVDELLHIATDLSGRGV